MESTDQHDQERGENGQPPGRDGRMSRRFFLAGVGVSVAAVVGLTAGQSFPWLAPFNAFGPRRIGAGPQSLPVNRTAAQARVTDLASDPAWRLTVRNGAASRALTRSELLAMEQAEAVLPIACVEGWSTSAHWRGVPLRSLVAAVGGRGGDGVRLTSLQPSGNYRVTEMGAEFVDDPRTLVALDLNGQTLDLDHGYPARMIAPGRPGVLQTKWLSTVEVLS